MLDDWGRPQMPPHVSLQMETQWDWHTSTAEGSAETTQSDIQRCWPWRLEKCDHEPGDLV